MPHEASAPRPEKTSVATPRTEAAAVAAAYDTFDSAMAARTPGRDIFGPLDDHLPEIRIPADVKVDVLRAANALGLDVTTWMRELVYGSLYGPKHLAMLHERRAQRVLGNAGQGATVVSLPVKGEVN